MKTILVTGASGFIGRHTIQPLLLDNFDIHAVYYSKKPGFKHHRLTWYKTDLLVDHDIRDLVQRIKPMYLLHLAWYTNPKDYLHSPENLVWLESSIRLVKYFLAAGGVRFVCGGTCFEYDVKNLYSATKLSFNLICQHLNTQAKQALAWARIFYLFGPHEHEHRFIPSLILSLLKNKEFTILNGYQRCDYAYVKDVAEALVSLLKSDIRGAVDIAQGSTLSLSHLGMTVSKRLQAESLLRIKTGGEKCLSANIDKLRYSIGWQPQYNLERAIDETIAWWQNEYHQE